MKAAYMMTEAFVHLAIPFISVGSAKRAHPGSRSEGSFSNGQVSVESSKKQSRGEKCSFDLEFCVPFLLSEVSIYSPPVLRAKF